MASPAATPGGNGGWVNITDRSAELALATALRILAIGIPAIIAVLGIDATDLADGFSQILHLPDRFVYGGLAGMRLFSVLQDDWTALTASRRSRGLGDDSAVASFFPQSFALLVLSIRRSTTLAVAMQARGFGGTAPRSHARMSHVHARDYWFLAGCLLIPVIALAMRHCRHLQLHGELTHCYSRDSAGSSKDRARMSCGLRIFQISITLAQLEYAVGSFGNLG